MHNIGNWRNQLEILRLRNLLGLCFTLPFGAFLGLTHYWTPSLLGCFRRPKCAFWEFQNGQITMTHLGEFCMRPWLVMMSGSASLMSE